MNCAILVLLATASASTVMIPATAREGEYITVMNLGTAIRIQVPQNFNQGLSGAEIIPLELEPAWIVPDFPSPEEKNSMQVHLHHTGHTNSASVAISWATPTASKCSPTVTVGDKSTVGVTRTYPTAVMPDKSAASFHHVQLGDLTAGNKYAYSLSCDGSTFNSTFTASHQTAAAGVSYSFAVFGDMGVSTSAHDTVNSMAAHLAELDAVYHIGDLSYARGKDQVWNQFFTMIEPIASKVPWDVVPGNHDMRNGDSSGECGLPMLARFETPSSQAAFPALAKLSDADRCKGSFEFSEGNPYWYAVDAGHARIITYSTDSDLTESSPQRQWLKTELEAANTPAARAVHPWVLLMGHKPMYTASTYPGCIGTRGEGAAAEEGTEGKLTAELEDLFVANKVDVSFYGHIHSYNRMFPVKDNGTTVEIPPHDTKVYLSPNAPVHMMIGMAGAGHLGKPYASPAWSAHAEIKYGWVKATFANSSALHLEFIANGDGLQGTPSVHDDVWIAK
jgi:hypothetical protein